MRTNTPHPDLVGEVTKLLIQGYDEGKVYPRIKGDALVWNHVEHGGFEDSIPRHLILIATALQEMTEQGLAQWSFRGGVDGILWTDEMEWVALDNVGVNKQIGFFSMSSFPDQPNDANLPDGCKPYESS